MEEEEERHKTGMEREREDRGRKRKRDIRQERREKGRRKEEGGGLSPFHSNHAAVAPSLP